MFFNIKNTCALLFFFSINSHAACTLLNGAKEGSLTVSMNPKTLDPGDLGLSVLAQATQAASLASSAMGIAGTTTFVRCTNGESLQMTNVSFTPKAGTSPGNTGFIETGIENLYFYITYTPGSATGIGYPTKNGGTYSRTVATLNNGSPRWTDIGHLNVYLYQNGRISKGGVVPAGTITRWQTSDGIPLLNINVNSFKVNVKACSVLNPSINVDMGSINKSVFSGVGSTAGGEEFTISMNCDSDIKPAVTFSGVTLNNGNVLSLNNYNSDTTAQGVGIQISHNSNQISFDSPLSLGTSLQGVNNFKFNAKYIQTNDKITGGKADATASFTITYQ